MSRILTELPLVWSDLDTSDEMIEEAQGPNGYPGLGLYGDFAVGSWDAADRVQ